MKNQEIIKNVLGSFLVPNKQYKSELFPGFKEWYWLYERWRTQHLMRVAERL